MRHLKNPITRIILLVFSVIPPVVWAIVKPVRVIAPGVFGIECFQEGVCVDDPEKYEAASRLHSDAVIFLNDRVHRLSQVPKVIFCSTEKCANTFGLGDRSAVTFGTYGSVIGPKAWKPYYVHHELIHQLQGQMLGILKCLILPSWLLEGMAYSLSEDPRVPLNEPWESDRTRFNEWLSKRDKSKMWQEAAGEW